MGHGTLKEVSGSNSEVSWQLTVLSSIADVFHICDNDIDSCKEQHLPNSSKLHIDEIFIPNRRNILGGIQISVHRQEYISFRAAATSPEVSFCSYIQCSFRITLRMEWHGTLDSIGS